MPHGIKIIVKSEIVMLGTGWLIRGLMAMVLKAKLDYCLAGYGSLFLWLCLTVLDSFEYESKRSRFQFTSAGS